MTTITSGSHNSCSANTSDTTSDTQAESKPSPAATLTKTTPDRGAASARKQSLREQKKAQARERILVCAQELINSQGYADTKMRGIAAAAKMSYQTLYNYFPTKGLILQELLARDLLKLRRQTFDSANSNDPLTTKLRDFAKGYVDAVAANERHLWLSLIHI